MSESTRWSGTYRPLRVVARLASPVSVVPGEPLLPLDGILEYAAFHAGAQPVLQYFRQGDTSRPLPRLSDRDPANFLLPVKRVGHRTDPDWFWSASWATLPAGFELDRTHWNKRFDGADPVLGQHLDFAGRRGRVSVASGRYKSYHMPIVLVVASELHWHVLGAADGIASLLRGITHLGHKRSQGHGEVLRWEVWPCRTDHSLWDATGQPARAIPESYLSRRAPWDRAILADPAAFERRHVACRAPHHHPSRRRLCYVPPAPAPGLAAASHSA